MAFAGTDHRIVQMAMTVPITTERVSNHVKMFNKEFTSDCTQEEGLCCECAILITYAEQTYSTIQWTACLTLIPFVMTAAVDRVAEAGL